LHVAAKNVWNVILTQVRKSHSTTI
jgi:hypothetical protein